MQKSIGQRKNVSVQKAGCVIGREYMIVGKRKWREEKSVVCFIFLMGLIMSFLIPIWQTPDEFAHLNMIGNSIKIEGFADKMLESTGIENERIEFHYDEKVDLSKEKAALVSSPAYQRSEMLPQGVTLSFVKHLPAALGILAGILIGLPTMWVMHMGELFSLLFYCLVCYQALKLMPVKKGVLALFMMFPMALQQAASINYDAVLLPLCFLFIAYVFYLKYETASVGLKETLVLLSIWGIITYIKIPYVFIIGLIFLIPLNQWQIKIKRIEINKDFVKKWGMAAVFLFLVLLIGAVYVFRHTPWVQIVYGFVVEWRRGIYLLAETGKTWGEFLMTSTVGNFGWLDTPMSFKAVIFVYVLAVFFALFGSDEKKLRKWDYAVLAGTIFCLCIFTTLAMVNHTIKITLFGSETSSETYHIRTALYQILYVGGLQGRYYLPFAALFFLFPPQKKMLGDSCMKMIFIAAELLVYLYVFYLLLHRYWIA